MCKLFATKYWLGEHWAWLLGDGGFLPQPILPSEKKRQKVLTRPPIEAGAQSRDTVALWTVHSCVVSVSILYLLKCIQQNRCRPNAFIKCFKFYLVFPTINIFVSIIRQLLCLKGTVSQDFLLLVFFMNQFPQAPDYTIRAVSNFFQNSWRYLATQGLPPVSLTPVANRKKLQSEKF